MMEPTDAVQTRAHDLPGDHIYHRIRETILRNRIGPGTKLAEARLCELFNANRETVRRALARLASDSVVEYYPKRGAFVASPSRELVIQVRDARMAIEPGLVTGLAANVGESDLSALDEVVADQLAHAGDSDPGIAIEKSGAFHVRLAELSGNAFCMKYLLELTALTCLAMVKFDVSPHEGCPIGDHSDIVDALRRGDGARAAAVLSKHLDGVHQTIINKASRPAPRRDLSGIVLGPEDASLRVVR
jgi:DNA-binding GntR family transcriptional regulator